MGSESILDIDTTSTTITDPGGGREVKTFTFDHSYGMDSEQPVVFADLGQPIVNKSLEGFNGTIFAYGQTGSGKTFSMVRRRRRARSVCGLSVAVVGALACIACSHHLFWRYVCVVCAIA